MTKFLCLICLGAALSACSSQTQRGDADLGSGQIAKTTGPISSEPVEASPTTAPVGDEHESINWIEPSPWQLEQHVAVPASGPAPSEQPAQNDAPSTSSADAPLPEQSEPPGHTAVPSESQESSAREESSVSVPESRSPPIEPEPAPTADQMTAAKENETTRQQEVAVPANDKSVETQSATDAPANATKEATPPEKVDERSVENEIVVRKETIVVDLNADPLFKFDKFALLPAMRERLDHLIEGLDDAGYTVIEVIGYTDRIGTAKYNQKLSERRADTVKKYLVSRGIPVERIQASGRGEKEPVTDNCSQKKASALIACLAPNRRVEVSVKARITK